MVNSDKLPIRGPIKDKFFICAFYSFRKQKKYAYTQIVNNKVCFSSKKEPPIFLSYKINGTTCKFYYKDTDISNLDFTLCPTRNVDTKTLYAGCWYMLYNNKLSSWIIDGISIDKVYFSFFPKKYYNSTGRYLTFQKFESWITYKKLDPEFHGSTDGKQYGFYPKYRRQINHSLNIKGTSQISYPSIKPKYRFYEKNVFTLQDFDKSTNFVDVYSKIEIPEIKFHSSKNKAYNRLYWFTLLALLFIIISVLYLFYENKNYKNKLNEELIEIKT